MASATTIRISERSHRVLRHLSEKEKVSLVEALDIITAFWEREQFNRELQESFAALREDAEALNEELEERRLWDSTLLDNLKDDR